MSGWKLVKTRLSAGLWEGTLTRTGSPEGNGATPPTLAATHLGRPLGGLRVKQDGAEWSVQLPIPADVIADGIQTIVITDAATGEALDSVALIAGDALADDIRAEVDLLRAELDLLKRAFRRHCVETA